MQEMRGRLAGSPLVQGTILLVLAGVTRLYRLTHWPLAGDEFFTIQDSQVLAFKGKPLLFYMNHYLIEPWLGLDVLGVRLLPVIFGIASIPLLYWAGWKLWGPAVGLFAALLALFNPWHLYLSQYARYYPLVFFLSILVLVAFYLAYTEESVGWLVGGVAVGILGLLAHASTGLVLGAIGAWIVFETVREYLTTKRSTKFHFLLSGIIVLGLLVATLVYFVPILIDWQRQPAGWGFAGPVLLMSFGQWMTAGASLFAVGGAIWMWRSGERRDAAYLVCIVALPFLFLALAGYVIKATVPYLFPAAPAAFLLAGWFLRQLYEQLSSTHLMARLATGVVLLAGIATGVPSFVSHYMDGSRPDFRSAANYLDRNVDSNEAVVLSDLKNALEAYLDTNVEVRGFHRSVEQLQEVVASTEGGQQGGVVWLTTWMRERGGFNEQGLGSATGWVRSHCVLRHVVSRPRLDYRRNDVHVYRCEA